MLKLKEFIQKIKSFISADPKRAKFIGLIIVVAALPLIIATALTVQNLKQRASGNSTIQIVNENGATIAETDNPNVFININLSNTNWKLDGPGVGINNLVKNAYAASETKCVYKQYSSFDCSDSPTKTMDVANTSSMPCKQDSDEETGQALGSYEITCESKVEPTPTTSPFSPQSTADCGNRNCLQSETCVGSSFDNSTFCLPIKAGGTGSYCGTPDKSPNNDACASGSCGPDLRCQIKPKTCPDKGIALSNYCSTPTTMIFVLADGNCGRYESAPFDCSKAFSDVEGICKSSIGPNNTTYAGCDRPNTASGNINSTSGAQTLTPNLLKYVYIENFDQDGNAGGSAPTKIMVNSATDITHIAWKLNDLLPGQDQAPRTVQVTLIGDNQAVPFGVTINLIRPTTPPSWTVNAPSAVNKIYDPNGDGVVNCEDTRILFSQYGQKGDSLSTDLNQDGTVDGIDFNLIVRNYTPGDTTVCK